MRHVFISYKREERDFADLVQTKIQLAGFNTWIDHNISPGTSWREAIDTAIQSAFALVVILTPEAHQSAYITYEWSFAIGVGIPVIPVLLSHTELHPRLDTLQFIDFTEGKRDWNTLIDRIGQLAVIADAEDENANLNWNKHANVFWLGGDLHTLAHSIWLNWSKEDVLRAARQSHHHATEIGLHRIADQIQDIYDEIKSLDFAAVNGEDNKQLSTRVWQIIEAIDNDAVIAQPGAKLWP